MENNIIHIADSLKKEIERDTSMGGKSLIDFSRKYAIENKLKYDALILKLNLTKSSQLETQMKVQKDMLILVDEIVKDYQENSESPKSIKSKKINLVVESHFSNQKVRNDVIFEAKELGKTYKSTGFSLRDINIQLRLGEIVSVVGENGNGKTTFFNIVAGELLKDTGAISYPSLEGGEENKIHWHKVKQEIAYIPQELPPWNGSLLQMLQFEAAIHGIKGEDNIREVNFIIQRLGLQEHLTKEWGELSGGFKLRFALARALVWKPQLLIIDEPLANLDIKTQLIVLKDIRNMASSFRYPMAVLLSSQHLHEIESVSDKILFLKKGEVSFYGELDQLGTDRQYNTFELNCEISHQALKTKLENFSYQKLYHNGISFVITTNLDIGYKQLLQYLLDNDVEVNYFRNISQSIKQLFEI